ncbi:MAG: putative ABC transporter permease subunit [Candidatus Nitrospinota bacterium M3_3B_026]
MLRSGLFILQKARFRLASNSVLRPGRGSAARRAVLGALAALFVLGDWWFFRRILVYFNSLPMDVGEILVIQLLNLLCLTLFSMLVFSNVIAAISTLYMSRDLELLLSAPLRPVEVFVSKFILTLINSSWMPVLFGMPIFVAYGQSGGASWLYYALLPAAVLPFLVAPSGLGVLFTMVLTRFFPARRAYQVLTFVGVLFMGGLVMYFRFLRPERFVGKDVPDEAIIGFVESLKAPDYPWLPSSMMASALQAGALGDWEMFWGGLGKLWAVAAAASAVAVVAAWRFYYAGWTAAAGGRSVVMPKKERMMYRAARKMMAPLAPESRALLMKDMKLFWRDTGQWSQLFILGALVVVYIFNIRNLPLDTVYLKNVVSVMNIGLAGVVLAAVAARFVFAAISVEGKGFWVIHSAPLDPRRLLWAKFSLYILPLIILAEALVVVSNLFLGVDGFVMAASAAAIAALTAGLSGLGTGMGAMYPKFDFENVAEVGTTTGAIMYMIISLAYVGASVSLVAGPVRAHLLHVFLGAPVSQADIWGPFAALLILTAVFVYAPMRMGADALARMETF